MDSKNKFNTGLIRNKDGSVFIPEVKSINEQILDNAKLIATLQQDIVAYPEHTFALKEALNSSVDHKNRLIEILREQEQSKHVVKYRKKPVIIETMQYTVNNAKAIIEWIGKCVEENNSLDNKCDGSCPKCLHIETLEGIMTASIGDFIIKGVAGEFYPIKEDIFNKTYELAEE